MERTKIGFIPRSLLTSGTARSCSPNPLNLASKTGNRGVRVKFKTSSKTKATEFLSETESKIYMQHQTPGRKKKNYYSADIHDPVAKEGEKSRK